MPRQLVRLFVKNVSAVDRAANKRTFLVVKAVQKEDHTMTFDDAMFEHRLYQVYSALSERYGAVMETIDSIRQSDEGDKVAAVKAALTSFVASMKEAIPGLVDEMSAEVKAGRKISAERLSKLKTLYKVLSDIIAEGENMTEKKAPDATALQKIGNTIAAMFGRAVGADDATLAELEKADDSPPIPEELTAAIAKASAENAELKARLEKAEQATTQLRDEAAAQRYAAEAADLGLDPAKDAATLKALNEQMPKEAADRLREVLKGAKAVQDRLFKERGTTGTPVSGSTTEEIQQKVDAIIMKNDKLDKAAALSLVFREDPALYEKYRQETAVKV